MVCRIMNVRNWAKADVRSIRECADLMVSGRSPPYANNGQRSPVVVDMALRGTAGMRLGIAAALLVAAPCAAQLQSPLAATTDPADRAVMAEVAAAVATRTPDMAKLDALLVRLPRPTPMRGMLQAVRAGVLAAAQDAGPALAAVEEAMRLLPDDPRPKLVATQIYTFSGSPQRAADLWMQASQESPDFMRMSDRYLMMALVGRLRDIGDLARADRLSARMADIGFSAGLAPERSNAALARVREALTSGAQTSALPDVSAIGNPSDLLTLYIDKRYSALWPRIAEWAGADLSEQSLRYLGELRRDWTATDDFETAAPYAGQLASLDAYQAVVALFLPMFERLQPGTNLEGAAFLAPRVARSLTHLGRSAEANALLAKVAAALPADDGGQGLNIEGAYITLAGAQTDWPQVLTHADAFLARAKVLGPILNRSAVLDVLSWRACALWRSGRTAEAEVVTAEVLLGGAILPSSAMHVHLCRGDVAAARALVIARLSEETTRSWALKFVQPKQDNLSTPMARLTAPIAQAVRTAADVIAAANKVGRILPQPVLSTVPAGFDPLRAPPRATPIGPDAV